MHRGIGRRVKDRITGFEGVVTGYCEYITGCNQALIAPPTKDDGEFVESRWFDEQRLVQLGDEVITLDNGSHPGPDKPAPIR